MNNGENVFKIRLKLPGGEEFEAEGTREFIEAQRNHFLTLIGQAQPTGTPTPTTSRPQQPPQHTELYLWERLLKEDGTILTLRPKVKLPPQDIALLLLAGARVLLKTPAYSALELAQSLKSCGAAGGRLDRLLEPEIQAGRLLAAGAKRSRTYQLTDEGFARAFALAEKLLTN